jgi:hypothetical protein
MVVLSRHTCNILLATPVAQADTVQLVSSKSLKASICSYTFFLEVRQFWHLLSPFLQVSSDRDCRAVGGSRICVERTPSNIAPAVGMGDWLLNGVARGIINCKIDTCSLQLRPTRLSTSRAYCNLALVPTIKTSDRSGSFYEMLMMNMKYLKEHK